MAKLCGGDCFAICDFCKFYQDDMEDGMFSGYGVCVKKNIKVQADGHCEDDFECFRIDEE